MKSQGGLVCPAAVQGGSGGGIVAGRLEFQDDELTWAVLKGNPYVHSVNEEKLMTKKTVPMQVATSHALCLFQYYADAGSWTH